MVTTKKQKSRARELLKPIKEPQKLELGYEDMKTLLTYPWPWASNSIFELRCVDVFHYVPAKDRGRFMDELYRVLVPAGQAVIIAAYYSTTLAVADFNLEWPPVCEQSFLYFNKGWREQNKLPYTLKCDFDYTYGYILTPEIAGRNQETQAHQIKTCLNTVQRIQVALTKRPGV